jgi:hypothetical protein
MVNALCVLYVLMVLSGWREKTAALWVRWMRKERD